jgi:hypothetical protein
MHAIVEWHSKLFLSCSRSRIARRHRPWQRLVRPVILAPIVDDGGKPLQSLTRSNRSSYGSGIELTLDSVGATVANADIAERALPPREREARAQARETASRRLVIDEDNVGARCLAAFEAISRRPASTSEYTLLRDELQALRSIAASRNPLRLAARLGPGQLLFIATNFDRLWRALVGQLPELVAVFDAMSADKRNRRTSLPGALVAKVVCFGGARLYVRFLKRKR